MMVPIVKIKPTCIFIAMPQKKLINILFVRTDMGRTDVPSAVFEETQKRVNNYYLFMLSKFCSCDYVFSIN